MIKGYNRIHKWFSRFGQFKLKLFCCGILKTQRISGKTNFTPTQMQASSFKEVPATSTLPPPRPDENGTVTKKQLKAKEVWSLSLGEKIILQWNDQVQPIDDGEGLLNRFLARLGRDFELFPICYENWRKVPRKYKDDVLENSVMAKFVIKSNAQESYVLKRISEKWREKDETVG